MDLAVRRLILALALAFPASARAGKRYESLMIDRVDMTATLGAPLGAFSSAKSYFDSTPLSGGGRRVADMRDGACRGAYDFSPENRLLHRERTLRVLERDFGHVYAHFHYWYPPETPMIAVATFAARRDVPHLPPLIEKTGSGKVDGFALIRVLKASPKFLVATADYALDGRRTAFRIEVSSGEWVKSSASGADEPQAGRFGLPKQIDPATFASAPFAERAPEAGSVELEAALIFHGRGATIERLVKRGSRVDRDWLSFPPTEIERLLSKVEASYPITRGRN